MRIISIIFLFINILWSQDPCEKLNKLLYKSPIWISTGEKNTIISLSEKCNKYKNDLQKKYSEAYLQEIYPETYSESNKSKKLGKISFMDALNDTLILINQNMLKMLTRYGRMIDLKRNILKSRLDNARMSFVYHKPKRFYKIYNFANNDRYYIGNLSDGWIKVFPDRITRGDGKQYILVEYKTSNNLDTLKGFINYKKIRKELPHKFIDIVETTSFKDYNTIKELTNNIENISSDEMDRWLEITGNSFEEEIKAKGLKKPNQNYISIILNTIVVLLFIINLSVVYL